MTTLTVVVGRDLPGGMDQKKKRGAGGGGVDDKAALIARNRAALQKRKDAAAAAKVAVGFELNPGPDQASLSTKT